MKFNVSAENGTREMSKNCTKAWSRHTCPVVFYIDYTMRPNYAEG